MTCRREFLQIGASAAAWPLVARAAHAVTLEPVASLPVEMVVYDTRFSTSLAYADRARALGVATRAIAGDMTRLWYDEIHHLWQTRPAPIAGVTTHGVMFCFAELARDVRMRVVEKTEHPRRVPDEPALYTWVIAPAARSRE